MGRHGTGGLHSIGVRLRTAKSGTHHTRMQARKQSLAASSKLGLTTMEYSRISKKRRNAIR
jgi:hypothetical protein